ncbi:MAG: T9SS type A sorting domain-containing protein [candidate division WOR-3 bacterium]|nr:MAG: T9SS type A sorting domain-containing protein [candidate division WOR-3 bacterium]
MVYFVVLALCSFIFEDGDSLIVDNDSLIICGNHVYNYEVRVRNAGKLKVRQWGYLDTLGWLVLNAPLIVIEDSSSIIGSGCGFWGGSTTHPDGFGPGYGGSGPQGGGGGGGYGGEGGDGGDDNSGSGGSSYGDSADTLINIGSGGGAGRLSVVDGFGGAGGAEVSLRGNEIIFDSSFIETKGQKGEDGALEAGGGGSGGGIMIRADIASIHYTSMNADGGSGGNQSFGGGGGGAGGGRIKIFYVANLDTSHLDLSVEAGAGGSSGYGIAESESGMPGSIYIAQITGIEEVVQATPLQHGVKTSLARNSIGITIQHTPTTLMIYDVSGRLVKTFRLTNNTEIIDLHDLKQGVYFLKFAGVNKTLGKIVLLK